MSTVPLTTVIPSLCRRSRLAALQLAEMPQARIDRALRDMARLLDSHRRDLQRANQHDLAAGRSRGLSAAMLDRLTLSDTTLDSMKRGLLRVAGLRSAVDTIQGRHVRDDGLIVSRVRTPIGVVGIIYESRPNVTVDAAAICLKSKNAVILRGGSEAFRSNVACAHLLVSALKTAGLPAAAIQIIPTTDRAAIDILLSRSDDVDLIIPRGGEELIRTVVEKSRIPVIKHYKGVCHVYISRHADLRKAIDIAVNAKVQRPGVCNAMETLLLDSGLPAGRRSAILAALLEKGAILFGDPATRAICPAAKKATTADWYAEYLDLRCAVRTVDGVDEAIRHINTYGSRHTDAIVTRNSNEARRFLRMVDSSSVMWNASTRLADGGEYGMGCEIGISTDKLHARGPMGIDELTTYKWVVEGDGHVRK